MARGKTIEVSEDTQAWLLRRKKPFGMSYDGFIRSMLVATEPSKKGK